MDLFENIKHTDEKGNDFWLYSELIKEFDAKSKNRILLNIIKSMKSATYLSPVNEEYFVKFTEMLKTTDGKSKFETNYKLSFNACCLIFKDIDYKNEKVDLAKSYFNEIRLYIEESKFKKGSIFDEITSISSKLSELLPKNESFFNLRSGNVVISDSLGLLKINLGTKDYNSKQSVSPIYNQKLPAQAKDTIIESINEKSIDNTTNYKSDIVQPANEPALNDEATKPVIVIQKSFEDYLLHEAKTEFANALKREFATEKGKSIRLLIETMQDYKTPLLSLCRGEGMKFYKAMKLFFNKDIGSYNSIFNYDFSKSKDEKDIQAITKRLNFILEQIK